MWNQLIRSKAWNLYLHSAPFVFFVSDVFTSHSEWEILFPENATNCHDLWKYSEVFPSLKSVLIWGLKPQKYKKYQKIQFIGETISARVSIF